MKKEARIAAAKSLYISGKSQSEIAKIFGVNDSTISVYKSRDSENWDVLKNEKVLLRHSNDKEVLYSDFVDYMYASIKEIRDDKNLSVAKKTDAIVKLGDAFSKMKKIAAAEDPQAYAKGIVKVTLLKLLNRLRSEDVKDDCIESIADTIMKYQEELADVSI